MINDTAVFLIDNFDSFTYNLVDELRGLGLELIVYRNSVSAQTVLDKMYEKQQEKPVLLMLSPGPGTPSEAGCMPELLKKVQGKFPVLGICLGHQAMVELHGGKIVRANQVMHGKSSQVPHCGEGVFANLPNPLPVARYHSLMACDMPEGLEELAAIDGIPMAVLAPQSRMLGFQFHPESILTTAGSTLLRQGIEYLTANQA